MNYSKGRWKNRGNRGIKRAEEITGEEEVGTTCNLEFWRWTFKVAITGSGHLAELYSSSSHVIQLVRAHTQMQVCVDLHACPHVGTYTQTHNNKLSPTHKLPTFHEKVKLLVPFPESIDCHSFNIRGLRLKFADELKNGLKKCQMVQLIKMTFCLKILISYHINSTDSLEMSTENPTQQP